MKHYTGIRKGISLVEMLIAVILFAALATIGLKYTKNYLNTELQAPKARVAAAMEQASQLTAAYKLYTTQYGSLTAITDLNATATQVMTSLPSIITEMSTSRWEFNSSTGVGSGNAFILNLDANTTDKSDEQYCAIWNKEFNSSVELNVTGTEDFGSATAPSYVDVNTAMSYCYGTGTGIKILVKLP